MHQLAIDVTPQAPAVSRHETFAEAHSALLAYVVRGDYYLYPVQNTAGTTYRLLRLADPESRNRRPTVAGLAIIKPVTACPNPLQYFDTGEAGSP
jgi:hypothetical protein